MTDRIISLVSEEQLVGKPKVYPLNLEKPESTEYPPTDSLGRSLHDLRISVTDRCNFRCIYCMPKSVFGKDYQFLPQGQLLTFEEIERVASKFVSLGVEKIRLTGGEPLLRKNIERLIEKLAKLKTRSGKALDLTLTTNATLLSKKAESLKSAGLNRVTVSMDALSNTVFQQMVDSDIHVDEVLSGIEAAHSAGLGPIKVNMVVKKSVNLTEIAPMARYFKGSPHILRFIEFMDVGSSNGWKMDEVVPSSEVISIINRECGALKPTDPNYPGEVAERWQYTDGSGEIGVISSVTQAFCKDCSRIRLSTEGRLYTCLFANRGHDLKPLLRQGLSNEEENRLLDHAIRNLWAMRSDRYSEVRTANTPQPRERIEMSYIGG